jgi:hypothetical protein
MSEFQEKQGMRILSVSGEAGKLEAENIKERLAMEKKLQAMEDQLNQQRNNAKKALAEQQRRMQAGETLSEEDIANLLADEKQMEQKTMSMEEELSRKKDLTDQIIKEQMKRTRETKVSLPVIMWQKAVCVYIYVSFLIPPPLSVCAANRSRALPRHAPRERSKHHGR